MVERDGTGSDLDRWLEPFLAALGHKKRRGWAPMYLRGLLGPSAARKGSSQRSRSLPMPSSSAIATSRQTDRPAGRCLSASLEVPR